MTKFFIINADKDAIAVDQITDYKVRPDDISGAPTIRFYHGAATMGVAVGQYAIGFLLYAAAHEADSIA